MRVLAIVIACEVVALIFVAALTPPVPPLWRSGSYGYTAGAVPYTASSAGDIRILRFDLSLFPERTAGVVSAMRVGLSIKDQAVSSGREAPNAALLGRDFLGQPNEIQPSREAAMGRVWESVSRASINAQSPLAVGVFNSAVRRGSEVVEYPERAGLIVTRGILQVLSGVLTWTAAPAACIWVGLAISWWVARGSLTGVCTHCGYDLAGLRRNAKCPECGKVSEVRTAIPSRHG